MKQLIIFAILMPAAVAAEMKLPAALQQAVPPGWAATHYASGDLNGDQRADAALYLPFAFIAPFGGLQIGLLIFLAAMSEFCGVLGQVHGNGRRYDGPLGKSDRAFIFGALGLWYALAGRLPDVFYWLMWLLLPLLLLRCCLLVLTLRRTIVSLANQINRAYA